MTITPAQKKTRPRATNRQACASRTGSTRERRRNSPTATGIPTARPTTPM